jgi:hypothetical protein
MDSECTNGVSNFVDEKNDRSIFYLGDLQATTDERDKSLDRVDSEMRGTEGSESRHMGPQGFVHGEMRRAFFLGVAFVSAPFLWSGRTKGQGSREQGVG